MDNLVDPVTEVIPDAACPRCGGWTNFGGMSQHSTTEEPIFGRMGCNCNTMKAPAWGLCPPPDGWSIAWGGRAIYSLQSRENHYFGNGKRRKTPKYETVASLDIPWDRQEMVGGDDVERKAFGKWVNSAIEKIRAQCVKGYITNDCDHLLEVVEGLCVLKANPRESCGYLYMSAYRMPGNVLDK